MSRPEKKEGRASVLILHLILQHFVEDPEKKKGERGAQGSKKEIPKCLHSLLSGEGRPVLADERVGERRREGPRRWLTHIEGLRKEKRLASRSRGGGGGGKRGPLFS